MSIVKFQPSHSTKPLLYQVRDSRCNKNLECFSPFTGNGIPICRGWELGRCPDKIVKVKRTFRKFGEPTEDSYSFKL